MHGYTGFAFVAHPLNYFKCIILGAGITGLSVAYQLIQRQLVLAKDILILDVEDSVGLHSSGRNSGVIHAGLYYKPGSLKSRVCVSGGQRLLKWANDRNIFVNRCGKLIIAQDDSLDHQLQVLYERGIQNGAHVEFISPDHVKSLAPSVCDVRNRALWSPATSVVSPLEIVRTLFAELKELGVSLRFGCKNLQYSDDSLSFQDGNVSFGFLFNCAGAYSVDVAHKFDLAKNYRVIPFKGNYWQLKKPIRFKIPCNIYPVPDLEVPFLGVHFTPSALDKHTVYIGPTATFAFGKKNYQGFSGIELLPSVKNAIILASQYLSDTASFRNYVHKQSYLWFDRFMLREAQKLVPSLTVEDIIPSPKVGIRAQVFNLSTRQLSDDFILLTHGRTAHVINSVSPAFTSSFSLGDLILNQSGFFDRL